MRSVIVFCVAWALLLPVAIAQENAAKAATAKSAAAKKPKAEDAAPAFTFRIDRTSFQYDGYTVWGTVTSNQPGRLAKGTTVVLTAYDAAGKLLGRAMPEVKTAGASEAGYVDACTIDTAHAMPAKVECTVVAPPDYQDLEVVKSTEKTASDTPLEFQLQKISSGYSGLQVWGKVTNNGDKTYGSVQVILTLYGPGGKFLGRGSGSPNPGKIGPGHVGYVDSLDVEAGDWKPVKLEWKIVTSGY